MALDYSVFKGVITLPNGKKFLNDTDGKVYLAYDVISDFMLSRNNRIVDKRLFGYLDTDDCDIRLVNDLHQLIFYLSLIWDIRIRDGETASTYNTEYIEAYCVNSLKNAFLCRGVDLKDIMHIFGLFHMTEPGSFVHNDGIGFMSIENTDDNIATNRISDKNIAIIPPGGGGISGEE